MSSISDAESKLELALKKLRINDVRESWPTAVSLDVESSEGYSEFGWEQKDDLMTFTITHSDVLDGVKEIVAWLAMMRLMWSKGYIRRYSLLPDLTFLSDVLGSFGLVLWSLVVFGPFVGFMLAAIGLFLMFLIIREYRSRLRVVNEEFKNYLQITDVFTIDSIEELVRNSRWSRKLKRYLPFIVIIGTLMFVILFYITLGGMFTVGI